MLGVEVAGIRLRLRALGFRNHYTEGLLNTFIPYRLALSILLRERENFMAFEDDASSAALSLIDVLESPAHAGTRVFAAVCGALVTICMWVVHLMRPDIFTYFLEVNGWVKLVLGFVLAPPFVIAFAIGSFLYPQLDEPKDSNAFGPMSAYLYQERASRRWKLLIAAGLFAGLNFVLMLVASGS